MLKRKRAASCYLSKSELITELPTFWALSLLLTAKGHTLAEHTLARMIFNDARFAK